MLRSITLAGTRMSLLYQLIFYFFLAGLVSTAGARAESRSPCELGVITNCPCALPIMQGRLSSAEIDLLIHAWVDVPSQSERQQSQFFAEQSANLLRTSVRYAEIQFGIALRCGDVAFRDE